MKHKQAQLIVLISILTTLISFSQSEHRIHKNFDFNWKFYLGDATLEKLSTIDDSNWEQIQLPHDWSIMQRADENNSRAMGFYPGGIGWYMKSFEVPAEYKGKKVVIHFDGVYHQSDVYVNGKHLGFHPYGYTGFEYDLTPHLNYGGENVIVVKVNHNDSPSSRWYSGSGIYRHVWLKVTNPVHVTTWGSYVTSTKITDNHADINVSVTIENNLTKAEQVNVVNTIIDANGGEIAYGSSSLKIKKDIKESINQSIEVKNPNLWSINSPYLYTLETKVFIEEKEVDVYRTPFGIRHIEFNPDKGFFLNGENVKLKGICVHPDAGSLGTALPDKSYLRRLKILKDYGCNAIRCSHNPPSPEFLDMCDSLGFVVIDEAFDKWKSGYYEKYFDEWWQKDMDAMVLRDRNHPSIILWSIGNETREQDDKTQEGTERAIMLRDYVHKIDPSRLVTAAIRPTKERNYNKTGFAASLDVVGYNYQEPWLLDDKEQFPERIMYISEAYPYYRGKNDTYKDFYPVNPWYDVENNDFVFGQFIWAGIDYLGESTSWPSTGWPTGLFDVCMFEKPSAAFHKAVWNEEPMVRIAVADQSLDIDPGKPHWSWPFLAGHWNFPQYKGHVIEVQTTTNCEEVELFLNDKSLGRRSTSNYTNSTIIWNIPYETGSIQAKGYNSGKPVTTYELKTSATPSRILLSTDEEKIDADGQDLAHITIQLVDEQGIPVAIDDKMLTIEILGNGKLIGLDNGDIRVESLRKENKIKTYFGKALATVQSTHSVGEVKILVKSEGLPDSFLSINAE